MKLIDELTAEHELIERVVGAFQTYVGRRIAGESAVADGLRFFRFLRVFVARYHHHREESVLFPALTADIGLPADRGPLPALLAQHRELEACLAELEPLLVSPRLDPTKHATIGALATRYAHGLWQHIDAENTVLFPESTARLTRASVRELPSREPTDEEASARDDGERLASHYPPAYDPSAMRGEGCVFCPSYATICEGVERTWWNDSEWEEFADHLG
jgi:hemerythrin-like domain-containing protein